MATPEPIGLTIKRARERKRLTQAQLAGTLGVSQKTVDNWEHDRTSPKSAIGALEHVLGVRFDAGAAQPPIISPRLRRVIREELDPEEQARVIGLLEGTLVREDGEAGDAAPRHG